MKKTDKVLLIVLVVLIIVFGAFLILRKTKPIKNIINNNGSSKYEKTVKTEIKNLTKVFYEDNYYTEENLELIKSIDDEAGLTINLSSLLNYDASINEIVNKKNNTKCDPEKTYVVIKSYEPYGKTDYRIEYHLDCGEF